MVLRHAQTSNAGDLYNVYIECCGVQTRIMSSKMGIRSHHIHIDESQTSIFYELPSKMAKLYATVVLYIHQNIHMHRQLEQ